MASKKPAAAPTKIVLQRDALAMITQQQAMIDQYRHVLTCLEAARDVVIQSLTGVDVRSGAWNLDLQQGVLERAGNN